MAAATGGSAALPGGGILRGALSLERGLGDGRDTGEIGDLERTGGGLRRRVVVVVVGGGGVGEINGGGRIEPLRRRNLLNGGGVVDLGIGIRWRRRWRRRRGIERGTAEAGVAGSGSRRPAEQGNDLLEVGDGGVCDGFALHLRG